MTLEKAIESNTEFLQPLEHTKDTDTYKAIKLGIEALKALNDCRKGDCTYHEELLLGETKEG